jgi:hypothetical protein
MRSDSSWSAERDTRAFLRGGRGDGPARASDGGAIRWTAAPDEVETPRVDVAIANARSRPSPGAVLVDFQRVRASRRPPTRAARTTTTAAATATTTTRVDPFDSLRCRSPARFTDECRRCALLRASATRRERFRTDVSLSSKESATSGRREYPIASRRKYRRHTGRVSRAVHRSAARCISYIRGAVRRPIDCPSSLHPFRSQRDLGVTRILVQSPCTSRGRFGVQESKNDSVYVQSRGTTYPH